MAQPPIPRLVAARLARWNAQHPNHAVDLKALNAVGLQEGYSGGIGDNGHAFGPFQLNNAGGVISGMFQGWAPQRIQQWATSPQGIDFALNRIGQVAGGLTGGAAVRAIVGRFERPANIPGETARALAAYGSGGVPPGGAANPLAASAPGYPPPGLSPRGVPPSFNLQQALGQIGAGDYSGFYQGLGQHLAQRQQQPQQPQQPVSAPTLALAAPPVKGGHLAIPIHGAIGQEDPRFLAELTAAARARGAVAIVATSGERSRAHNAAVGGVPNSNHLPDAHGYGHALDGYAVLADGSRVPLGTFLRANAGRYGLRSGATFNYRGRPDVVHVDDNRNHGR